MKSYIIICDVIPRHKKWKEVGSQQLEPNRTRDAESYWTFRKVSFLFHKNCKANIHQRVNDAYETILKIKIRLRALELGPASSRYEDEDDLPTFFPKNKDGSRISIDTPTTQRQHLKDFGPKFVRKPPVPESSKNGESSVTIRVPSRPSSTSSSTRGAIQQSQQSHSSDNRSRNENPRTPTPSSVFPKANVIEPGLLLSYLSQPERSRPSILLLDVRPKEQYDMGHLNAENVVWIDPILLDQEYKPRGARLICVLEYLAKILKNPWFSAP